MLCGIVKEMVRLVWRVLVVMRWIACGACGVEESGGAGDGVPRRMVGLLTGPERGKLLVPGFSCYTADGTCQIYSLTLKHVLNHALQSVL